MKKVSASKNFMKNNSFLACSECESAEVIETEEEIHCQGCNPGFVISPVGFSEDFIWHPKRKY